MRVLLDSCIWPGAKKELARAGHEVEWVGEWQADPGDAEVLAHAARREQIIVTLDKDFGELAVALAQPHVGIALVAEFDSALAQSPGLTSWAVTNALLQFHLSGSDDAAIGGDLAYWYGRNNGFIGISLQAAQQVLGAVGFGSDAQSLHPFSGLQEGYVKLA